MNADKGTELLIILEYFEELFGGTLGDLDTVPVNLGLKPGSNPFNSKYYTFHIINKDTFHKEIKSLAKMGVLNPVQ